MEYPDEEITYDIDNKVYILKNCKKHGEQLELLEHDVNYYKNKKMNIDIFHLL